MNPFWQAYFSRWVVQPPTSFPARGSALQLQSSQAAKTQALGSKNLTDSPGNLNKQMLEMDLYPPRVCLTWYNWEKKQCEVLISQNFRTWFFSKHLISTYLPTDVGWLGDFLYWCPIFPGRKDHSRREGNLDPMSSRSKSTCHARERQDGLSGLLFQGELTLQGMISYIPPNEKRKIIHSKISLGGEYVSSTSFFLWWLPTKGCIFFASCSPTNGRSYKRSVFDGYHGAGIIQVLKNGIVPWQSTGLSNHP